MISVLMPAYVDSSEKQIWIVEAIESLQQQTFENWELIIVDDNSPYSINFDRTDARIRIVKTVNRSGPGLCRNDAVALATYNCLLPLDSDDKLADPHVLEFMYAGWVHQPNKIIFGDIQRLELIEGVWRASDIFNLPDYTFERVMDLNGIIPVTAMHSRECHLAAGGWKGSLDSGLEDVEYWIAAGKAGYCGQRIPGVVLQYRKHTTSRFFNLRENKREGDMRNLIITMHTDIYEGRFPMGCCGGGQAYTPPQNNNGPEMEITTLDQVVSSEKVWVEYAGAREGGFGIVGKFSNISYQIKGPGHKFEVHVQDLPIFQRQRGVNGNPAFVVGVAVSQPTKSPWEEYTFKAQEPELAPILELA